MARRVRWSRVLAWVAFAVACAVNLYALYMPSLPGGATALPGADKVVHLVSFAAVMATGVLAGLRPVVLGAALAVHAVGSELLQGMLVAQRTADPWDATADMLGIALGWLSVRATRRVVRRGR